MAEVEKIVAAEPAVEAVPAVDADALVAVDENDNWKLEGAVDLDEAKHVGVKRKLHELQKKVSRREAKGSNICRRRIYAG